MKFLDSIAEVLGWYLCFLFFMTAWVALTESWTLFESWWWLVVTITTTGYGDISPKTEEGQLVASFLMIGSWLFNVMLAGMVAAKLIVNSDAWTHSEQEEVKSTLRKIADKLGD